MNIYFLVEGRRTEKKVYPRWLEYLIPDLVEIKDPFEVKKNNFYIFNGNGFPSILDNHLRNSIADVNSIGKFNYLVMCIDADEMQVEERIKEVTDFVEKEGIKLIAKTIFYLIVQNRCIETWCLGNRKDFKRNPDEEILRDYVRFYNVRTHDPELMGKIEPFETYAQFHAAYLKKMLCERKKIRYAKKNPNGVVEKTYLEELIRRLEETHHITTFHIFLAFCNQVKKEINDTLHLQ